MRSPVQLAVASGSASSLCFHSMTDGARRSRGRESSGTTARPNAAGIGLHDDDAVGERQSLRARSGKSFEARKTYNGAFRHLFIGLKVLCKRKSARCGREAPLRRPLDLDVAFETFAVLYTIQYS
jgi:hypothetical protein